MHSNGFFALGEIKSKISLLTFVRTYLEAYIHAD
jgi:hypothetical protein